MPSALQNFPLRIDRGLRARLELVASHEGRRVSELARELLRHAVEDRIRNLQQLGDPLHPSTNSQEPHETLSHS